MPKQRRRLIARPRAAAAALLVLGAAATLAGCGGGGSSSDPIEIAVEGPMSGDQAATGTDMRNAAKLAVDQANAKGGVLGRKLELVEEDDKADPETGKQVAQDAIDQDVFAVVGPYNSAVGVENLKLYLDAGVVPIHLTSNEATDGMGYTVQPKDYQVAPVEAKAITGLFDAKRVAIVYDTSTYTAGIAQQVKQALTAAGADVVLYKSFTPTTLAASSLAKEIEAAKPDLFYASTYYPEGGKIAAAAAAQNLDATCLMGLANQDAKFVQAAGLAAARRCYASGVPSAEQFSGAKSYVTDYRKAFGSPPGTWGTFTYDSVELLFAAARKAGSWDADAIRKQLSATRDYDGITGTIDINPQTGNREVVPVVILRIDDRGAYVVDPKWAKFAGFSL